MNVIDNADFKNSQIMKLGETYHTSLNASGDVDRVRIYRFILDDNAPVQIV